MFVVVHLERTIDIQPQYLGTNVFKVIRLLLNRKLSNKVVHNVGLCIAIDHVTTVHDSFLQPMKSPSYTKATFKLIVFRPKLNQILMGKVRSCCQEGVYVTLGFFEDILIPQMFLPRPSRFNEVERVWVWQYTNQDGSTHDLFMDIDETVKFRVVKEIFEELPPIIDLPDSSGGTSPLDVRPPYRLVGAINESGLGVVRWWNTINNETTKTYPKKSFKRRYKKKERQLKAKYKEFKKQQNKENCKKKKKKESKGERNKKGMQKKNKKKSTKKQSSNENQETGDPAIVADKPSDKSEIQQQETQIKESAEESDKGGAQQQETQIKDSARESAEESDKDKVQQEETQVKDSAKESEQESDADEVQKQETQIKSPSIESTKQSDKGEVQKQETEINDAVRESSKQSDKDEV